MNPFLNPLAFNLKDQATTEQELYHDLGQEIINNHGIPVYYIERELVNYDGNPFGEDTLSKYNKATQIDVYFANPKDGYDTTSTLYSKFGLTLSNSSTFLVEIKDFQRKVKFRPTEGDIICLTPFKNLLLNEGNTLSAFPTLFFEIKQVAFDAKGFNYFGDTFFYEIKAEQWNYSNEIINTGIADIDQMYSNMKTNDENGNLIQVNEPWDDSKVSQEIADEIADWTPDHPFGNVETRS